MPKNKNKPGKYGTISLQKSYSVSSNTDIPSLSSVNDSGDLNLVDDTVYIPDEISGPLDQEPIAEFEARRKANLLLLDCPNNTSTVEEKMQTILNLFPEKVWPIQVRYR